MLLALFLQAMYGAVDLMVAGQFGRPADVSAVSTGSQVMHTVTSLATVLARLFARGLDVVTAAERS